MPTLNRVLIQSRVLDMSRDEDSGNFVAVLDVPEEASLVVHELFPQDDDHAQVTVTVAQVVAQFEEDDDESPTE